MNNIHKCFFLSVFFYMVCNTLPDLFGKDTKGGELPPDENVVAMVKRFHDASFISTLTVSYAAEERGQVFKNWKLLEWGRLSLDIKNGKYRYLTVRYPYVDKEAALSGVERSPYLEAKEYFVEDGKETFIRGMQKNAGAKRVINDSWLQKSVTIDKADGSRFGGEMNYLYVSVLKHKFAIVREQPLNFFSKNIFWEKGTSTWTAKVVTKLDEKHSICDSFSFDVTSGYFVESKSEIIGENNKVLEKLSMYEVPDKKYFCQKGTYFPKELIEHHYSAGKIQYSVRYIFDDDIKINEEIPASYFVPKIKNGVSVLNVLEKKSYTHISKGPSANGEEGVKRLDEIFENATKKK